MSNKFLRAVVKMSFFYMILLFKTYKQKDKNTPTMGIQTHEQKYVSHPKF